LDNLAAPTSATDVPDYESSGKTTHFDQKRHAKNEFL
jgi:hypothetical protein